MAELVQGSNEQMVEYVTLKKLRAKVQEVARSCPTAQSYLTNIDKALAYYHIYEDERYWKLLALAEDDLEFQKTLTGLENTIYTLDGASNRMFRSFLIFLSAFLVFWFLFPYMMSIELFALCVCALGGYAFYAVDKLNNLAKPLSGVLLNIVQNSEFTYGKRSPI